MLIPPAPERAGAIFIGDIALDEYYRASRWPGLRDKLPVEVLEPQVGGTIANAACCHAAYGAPTKFVSALNSSPVSDRLRAHLEASSIDTSFVGTNDSLPDSKTLVFLVGGEHAVFLPDLGDYRLDVSGALLAELRAAGFVYSNGLELRRLDDTTSDQSTIELLQSIRDAGTRIAIDLDVDGEDDDLLGVADVVFINEVGFGHLCAGEEPTTVVARVLALGVDTLAVTRGADGCSIYRRESVVHLPGIAVDAIDVTGAGDTFGASFLYALGRSGDVSFAARFANAAAARATTIIGPQAGAAGASAVITFMSEQGLIDAGDALAASEIFGPARSAAGVNG